MKNKSKTTNFSECHKRCSNSNIEKTKKRNFQDINPKLCTKCGTCVGICPTNALKAVAGNIKFNKNKCISCSICYNNCPGIDFKYEDMNKFCFNTDKNIKLNKEIGNHKSIHIAQSKNKFLRENSASGGAVTAILKNAFEKKIIGGAIIVSMSKEKPWMYEARLATDKEEIINSRGSKYTIVSLNSILKITKDFKGKLAFVGLPCHVHGIRKLQKNKHSHVKNISFVVGIFCGFNVSLDATKFLIKKLGVKQKEVKSLTYRGGKWPGGLLVKTINSKKENIRNIKENKKTYFLPKYYYDITDTMFVPKRCLTCIDYMNDFADLSFGDIWLKELNREAWGAMIIRSRKGKELIKKIESCINIKPLSLDKLTEAHEHNIKHKKIGSLIRMKSKEERSIYGCSPLKYSNKTKKNIIIESIIFKITGNRLFRTAAGIVPLSIMGYAARMRRKLAKKTI